MIIHFKNKKECIKDKKDYFLLSSHHILFPNVFAFTDYLKFEGRILDFLKGCAIPNNLFPTTMLDIKHVLDDFILKFRFVQKQIICSTIKGDRRCLSPLGTDIFNSKAARFKFSFQTVGNEK